MALHQMLFEYPAWLSEWRTNLGSRRLRDADEQVACANQLARLNVMHKSGGPFGAIVVDTLSGELLGCGVNCVLSQGSLFHAETVAVWDAQRCRGSYDLGARLELSCTLAVSSAPCVMCLGAIMWSGIRVLVTGATSADVESITGFDEGPLPPGLQAEFNKRGIHWVPEVLREECCEVLRLYRESGGEIYNGGKGFR